MLGNEAALLSHEFESHVPKCDSRKLVIGDVPERVHLWPSFYTRKMEPLAGKATGVCYLLPAAKPNPRDTINSP